MSCSVFFYCHSVGLACIAKLIKVITYFTMICLDFFNDILLHAPIHHCDVTKLVNQLVSALSHNSVVISTILDIIMANLWLYSRSCICKLYHRRILWVCCHTLVWYSVRIHFAVWLNLWFNPVELNTVCPRSHFKLNKLQNENSYLFSMEVMIFLRFYYFTYILLWFLTGLLLWWKCFKKISEISIGFNWWTICSVEWLALIVSVSQKENLAFLVMSALE